MMTKRIIPCLDIKEGRTVKGVCFEDLRDAGDPVALGRRYSEEGADELVFLDITATVEGRGTFVSLVERIAENLNVPFTVGGGVRTSDDVRDLLLAGADKISVNSAAIRRPELIGEIAGRFGSQCVVVAVDAKYDGRRWTVHTEAGRKDTGMDAVKWASRAEALGAGELLVTSMSHDGVKNGFAVDLTREISGAVGIPVIASGGAGSPEHFAEVLGPGRADAALASSVFHFGEIPIPELKRYLSARDIPVRL